MSAAGAPAPRFSVSKEAVTWRWTRLLPRCGVAPVSIRCTRTSTRASPIRRPWWRRSPAPLGRARDSSAVITDHYTGVGEVLAVHALDNVFGKLHQQIRVKRGSLFSLDDAKNNDLIFIGSPSENLTLLELPNIQEFNFRQITSGPRMGTMEIINFHPESGEPKEFLPSLPDETLTEDYSVIALKRGLNPAHSVLILAGATTIGTQAAVEYVCQQNSLEELLLRLSVSNSGELKPFEAVIRVKVAKGVPVGSELVALRRGPA